MIIGNNRVKWLSLICVASPTVYCYTYSVLKWEEAYILFGWIWASQKCVVHCWTITRIKVGQGIPGPLNENLQFEYQWHQYHPPPANPASNSCTRGYGHSRAHWRSLSQLKFTNICFLFPSNRLRAQLDELGLCLNKVCVSASMASKRLKVGFSQLRDQSRPEEAPGGRECRQIYREEVSAPVERNEGAQEAA